MRNTKKAFTLVELIVVITILAILGTIAFISFSGQTSGARNTKVTSDIRNLVSAVEVATNGPNAVLLNSVVDKTTYSDRNTNNKVNQSLNFGQSGNPLNSSGTTYNVGAVDYVAIGQNGDDFKDPNTGIPNADNEDYLFAIVVHPDFKGYQIAGQVIENDTKKARVNGTYFASTGSTQAQGIISGTGSSNNEAVLNNTPITGNLY